MIFANTSANGREFGRSYACIAASFSLGWGGEHHQTCCTVTHSVSVYMTTFLQRAWHPTVNVGHNLRIVLGMIGICVVSSGHQPRGHPLRCWSALILTFGSRDDGNNAMTGSFRPTKEVMPRAASASHFGNVLFS